MISDETDRKTLIFLILQFLNEEGYNESLHLLEQESKVLFNFSYFSDAIINGNWKVAEDYLSAFTSPEENTFSRKMFFELYKSKFSEAQDRSGGSESVNVFSKELRGIPVFKDDGYEDLVEVIADIRVLEQTCIMDKASLRAKLCVDLHNLGTSNPSLCGKLGFPELEKNALMSLIVLICPNGINGGLKEDLIFLILQFLFEAKYKNTLHKLEQETKVLFNLKYLAELMTLGKFDKAEEYLTAFTNQDENKYSKAMFLEIQKLQCLESAEREVTKIKLHDSVIMLAKKNPVLKDKLNLPNMGKSSLLTLMKKTVDFWGLRTCNHPNSLENFPVVPYLCRARASLGHNVNEKKRKEINDPSECNALFLPDNCPGGRIACLTYSASGDYVLALAEDATHKLWTWSSSPYEYCKYTPRVLKENVFPKPRLHQPQSGITMKNDIATAVENSTSCFAIKGSYIFSTSGGKIAVFDVKRFEKVATFGSPTPTATCFIFIPGDLLAVGLDDGSIFVHCLSSRTIKANLEGHEQRITCLAFSRCFNVLVSSGADGKLCVWSTKSWEKLTSDNFNRRMCTRNNHESSSSLVTHIQFDPYQIDLLVVEEKFIFILKAPTLDCLLQWVSDESDGAITCAAYSSDGEIIYVGSRSGSIKILDSKTFRTICKINLTAFTRPILSIIRLEVYPTVVAAHPSHPRQISVGLSNGKVIVLQPLGGGGWGEEVPLEGPEDDGDYSDSSDSSY